MLEVCMAKRNNKRIRRGIRSQQAKSSTPATAIVVVVALVLFGGVAAWALTSGGGDESQDTVAASTGANGETTVISGSVHTVRHYNGELPTSSNPRADGLPTLVWFSGTWCHFCHHMSDFTYPVADEFEERLAFVEKSVDHDRDAALRFRIRGTPTFVMLDRSGEEVTRFSFQNDAVGFRQAIEAALGAHAGT
jgi:thiol-disulfide isomerase/thioredoxin